MKAPPIYLGVVKGKELHIPLKILENDDYEVFKLFVLNRLPCLCKLKYNPQLRPVIRTLVQQVLFYKACTIGAYLHHNYGYMLMKFCSKEEMQQLSVYSNNASCFQRLTIEQINFIDKCWVKDEKDF